MMKAEYAVRVESATGYSEVTRRRFTDLRAASQWANTLGKVWKRASVVTAPGKTANVALPRPAPETKLFKCFASLERAAAAGERCPTNGTFDVNSTLIGALARKGKIRVEVYAQSYRVVYILSGPHAGKSTARSPIDHGRPYRVIGAERRAG